MLSVRVTAERIFIGERFSISFQRTLRLPESYRASKLPPGFGPLPLQRVADYSGRTPKGWQAEAVFIPLDAREAMWLSFNAANWKPNAVKVGLGEIDAISGEAWADELRSEPQNYVVCPLQLWLDGVNAGENFVRQFVSVPLAQGYTVESQVMGGVETGGIRIKVFEPKPGIFPDQPPPKSHMERVMHSPQLVSTDNEFGIGAGAKIEQRIYPDPHGVDAWDPDNSGEVFVHLTSSEMYRRITGLEAPPSPVSARSYTEHGLGPWFELMDESLGDISTTQKLSRIKSVRQIDDEKGLDRAEEEQPIEMDKIRLRRIPHHSEEEEK